MRPHRLRIIAGRFKNRWIAAPRPGRGSGVDDAALTIRPTGDRVREAAFNMLGLDGCAGRVVLDAFAGTGAMGLEALSRGAAKVVFVEIQPEVVEILEANIASLGVGSETAVLPANVLEQEHRLRFLGPFDLILLDPPYGRLMGGDGDAVLPRIERLLTAPGILDLPASIVLEHAAWLEPPDRLAELRLLRRRQYGNAALSIYESP